MLVAQSQGAHNTVSILLRIHITTMASKYKYLVALTIELRNTTREIEAFRIVFDNIQQIAFVKKCTETNTAHALKIITLSKYTLQNDSRIFLIHILYTV